MSLLKYTILFIFIQTTLLRVSWAIEPLIVPVMTNEQASAGKRVKVVPPEYQGSDVYYSLYLPENYKEDKQYPVIVEYTGNYFPPTGSTGEVKDANLGYAIAKRLNAIWIVMPYVDGKESVLKWWGSEQQTIDYALTNIRRVCLQYGGDPAEVFLTGFSRGAIAVNYLGLHDDDIADVWLGLFSHDQYDGGKEWKGKTWGTPLAQYREAAGIRLTRMKGRSVFISGANNAIIETEQYLHNYGYDQLANMAFQKIEINTIIPDIPNKNVPHTHTDKWLLYPSSYREKVLVWFEQVIRNKPNTYHISGRVVDQKGQGVEGIIVDSGKTHFAITNKQGHYILNSLRAGYRMLNVSVDNQLADYGQTYQFDLKENVKAPNIIVMRLHRK